MKIDLQVHAPMLRDPDFLTELLAGCVRLGLPGAIRKACIHEVAHLIYFNRVIDYLKYPEEFRAEFVGPSIDFQVGKHDVIYTFSPASISTQFGEGLPYTDDLLQMIADGAVAGGVALLVLENETISGDGWDRFVFQIHYDKAKWNIKPQTKKPEDYWTQANTNVTKELQNEQTQKMMRDLATIYENRFYIL